MKKAKEMFKNLGYKSVKDNEEIIKFEHNDGFGEIVCITFDKRKEIYWVECLGRAVYIFPPLHEAINQMLKELEWRW